MSSLPDNRFAVWRPLLRQPQMGWIVTLTALFLFTCAWPTAALPMSPGAFLALHEWVELLSIAVALMVASLAWNLQELHRNQGLVAVGAGFLGVALLDLGHTLSGPAVTDLITPNNTNKAVLFWLAARGMGAVALLAATAFNHKTPSTVRAHATYLLSLLAVTAISVLIIFDGAALPTVFVPGHGPTAAKICAEYLIAMIYIGTAAILVAEKFPDIGPGRLWIAGSAWLLGIAELFGTLYLEPTDWPNALSHIYKVIACAMMYRALFVEGIHKPYRELAFERSWLQALLGAIPDPVWLKDADGRYLSCNSAFETRFGTRIADMRGKTDYDFFARDEADIFRTYDRIALEKGRPVVNEEWVKQADGELHLLETTKTPPRLPDGSVIGVLGIARDITASKHIENELRIAATTFESMEGTLITDVNRVVLRANRAFSAITGYSADDLIGKTPEILRSDRHDDDFYRSITREILRHGSWRGEMWGRRKNGEDFPLWFAVTQVRDSNDAPTHYVINLVDTSERKAANERIAYLSLYDSLTRLPNRKLLFDRLGQAVRNTARHQQQGALLLIDLDNFKALNETEGHEAGDQLLVEVSLRLLRCVGHGDTIARIGGDEFAVVLEELDRNGAGAVQAELRARDILEQLGAPFQLHSATGETREYHCASGIGIALFSGDVDAAEELFKRADTAVYRAKAMGRNSLCFFDPQMQAAVAAHASLEADLRRAIAHDQLLLHYQPQVNAAGQIIGAEALIRWQHPQRGAVSPAHFIPLAEETGLIVPIGQWVLQTACAQLAQWQRSPVLSTLTLAVNVSARQFAQRDFVDKVLAVLEATGARADRLKLELTESLLAQNTDDVIEKMHALKARGVRFALDDFGTGYSSLAYLKRLPLDQLKIDQTFVRDVVSDVNDAAIANTIIALGQTLGLSVIAEGVETVAQRDFLREHNCRLFQGYLFGRPLPLVEFERHIRERPVLIKS